MTIDEYNNATAIIKRLEVLNDYISSLKDIMHNDTTKWMMEVRPSSSSSLRLIEHYGLLPEFLDAVLKKAFAEYAELKQELSRI